MSFPTVLLATGTAVAVNAGHSVSVHKDPVPQLFAGGILLTALAFLDTVSPEMASVFAVIFLASTILIRGSAFFTWLSALVSPKG